VFRQRPGLRARRLGAVVGQGLDGRRDGLRDRDKGGLRPAKAEACARRWRDMDPSRVEESLNSSNAESIDLYQSTGQTPPPHSRKRAAALAALIEEGKGASRRCFRI